MLTPDVPSCAETEGHAWVCIPDFTDASISNGSGCTLCTLQQNAVKPIALLQVHPQLLDGYTRAQHILLILVIPPSASISNGQACKWCTQLRSMATAATMPHMLSCTKSR
jgi:hypothetical protein